MIILSEKILGPEFLNVTLYHVEKLGVEKGVDLNEIQNKLNISKSKEDFVSVIHTYFGDELKLK